MISNREKLQLKKYRHIIAALIEESLGYFTPSMALYAVECQKNNEVNACEWYFHMASIKIKNSSSTNFEKVLLQVNHDTIKRAFRRRHHLDINNSLRIVDYNIEGYESIGASWF